MTYTLVVETLTALNENSCGTALKGKLAQQFFLRYKNIQAVKKLCIVVIHKIKYSFPLKDEWS